MSTTTPTITYPLPSIITGIAAFCAITWGLVAFVGYALDGPSGIVCAVAVAVVTMAAGLWLTCFGGAS